MSTKMLLFWLSTTVIFLALVFVSGTYFYLYFRDKKMVRLATSSIKGTVVGYNSFREGNPPIVEYKVNGVAYKNPFVISSLGRFQPHGDLNRHPTFSQEKRC